MAYEALARKWRPRNFIDFVGQEHVVRVLISSLEQERIHHAWIFTGTRGVGKTTLARILAKSLNCIGPKDPTLMHNKANPCGLCTPCLEIDAGRFLDYIELDAASNRGVDDIAKLLETASYAPSAARFKIFMIDEVHMLTTHAFNAMLKSLEEPPSHVKFILATTDPQKIPITVLSRCLRFNLKTISIANIVGYLEHILNSEHISFEVKALYAIAKAANGSMRDAVSLLEQAISYGSCSQSNTGFNIDCRIGALMVQDMLGSLDSSYVIGLMDALVLHDAGLILKIADEIYALNLPFATALQELSSVLHKIALVQIAPQILKDHKDAVLIQNFSEDESAINRFAKILDPETVQLFYQIANLGRQDLNLAPDEYAGFTMTMFRMLAFKPNNLTLSSNDKNHTKAFSVKETSSKTTEQRMNNTMVQDWKTINIDNWPKLATDLQLQGLAYQLAYQSQFMKIELLETGNLQLYLRAPLSQMTEINPRTRLENALKEYWGISVKLILTIGEVSDNAQLQDLQKEQDKISKATKTINEDPFVQRLVNEFGMSIVPDSINSARESN